MVRRRYIGDVARITKAKLLKSSWGCGQVEFCVDVEEEMRLEYGSGLKVKKKKEAWR